MTMTMTMTMGMRLDSMLNEMDNLSSTQLYGLIVAATVGLCLVLLGTGHNPEEGTAAEAEAASLVKAPPVVHPTSTLSSHQQQRQPRWHIFKYVNVVASLAFVCSVAQFALYSSYYMEHGLVNFLIGWSLFLCYFFGFFGVSIIYNDLPVQPSQESSNSSAASASFTTKTINTMSTSSTTIHSNGNSKKVIHPPADCTPVCSDPTSFTKVPSSTKQKAPTNLIELDDTAIAQLVLSNQVKDHELEKRLDPFRAVEVRRIAATVKLQSVLGGQSSSFCSNPLEHLPSTPSLDYSRVYGANCEIVIGYVPLPVGLVGPLTLNNQSVYVPMATTEGCLVASTNRGAKAISASPGGAQAMIVRDGITRAPCVRMASAMEAAKLKAWCETPANFAKLKTAFESTTSFGKLQACQPTIAGRNVYLRLVCFAGDAMGMNMVSKGSLAVIELLQDTFPTLQLVALSGNMCTDKKAAATNWLEGRGKSVVVEAIIPASIVKSVLKTSVQAMVHTNLHKNLIGSAMAGAMGGFNAHASNIVTAVFLATGQDPAQNVESSNCITLLEETTDGDLWISCTMPSIEVGTVGGGTSLPAQAACLQAMGVKGGSTSNPGDNAKQLAMIVAAATMAGELSLLAALAANTLVQAHMTHNRKTVPTATTVTTSMTNNNTK